MGCAASSPVAEAPPANVPRAQAQQHPPPVHAPRAQPQPHAPAEPEPAAPARPAEEPAAAASTPFDFELRTPMLVMPYAAFKAQGRIFKSVKAWREEALREGRLTVHAEAGRDHRGKIVVFISHSWWDRDFLDPDRDPDDPYDKGAPDYQSGDKQDLKWRVICSGVESLVKQEGLNEEEVALWLDWQSIFQDDKAEKNKGVQSLLKYATLCDYMLVPIEQAQLDEVEAKFPEEIPGYGKRGWCRCEYFIFSLAAEMREREVELYAILSGGGLQKYPAVKVEKARYMPSGGAFANPADKASVQKLEDQMIEAYGTAVVVAKCKADGAVDLPYKMLRAVHMNTLGAAVAKNEVEALNLEGNQLGADGGKALAAVMSQMPSLKELIVEGNGLGVEGGKAFAAVLKDTQLTNLNVAANGLGVEGGKAFAAVLKDTQLTNLNIADNVLTNYGKDMSGVLQLAEALPQTKLTTLNIAGNALANNGKNMSGVLKLVEALPQTKLTSLNISWNDLGVDGGKAFAAVLKDTQITNLNIANNVLTNYGEDMSGVLQLAEALPQTKLTTLNISDNELGVEGGKVFAAVLKDTQLTNLNLDVNQLGPKGGAAIAEGLKGNTTLKELSIGYNNIGVEGGKAFAAVLKDTQLTNLKLGGCSLNDDAKQALQEAAGTRVALWL